MGVKGRGMAHGLPRNVVVATNEEMEFLEHRDELLPMVERAMARPGGRGAA